MYAFLIFALILVNGVTSDKEKETPEDQATKDHESVLGSHKLAEDFKELAPEESKLRLKVLIGRMDKNSDGVINKDELVQWIINSQESIDLEETKSDMLEKDDNKDEKLSWDEYVHHDFGYSKRELEYMAKDQSKEAHQFREQLEERRKMFDAADLDGDQSLNMKELVTFTRPYHYQHMAPLELEKTFADYDKNKDGKVDLKEFTHDAVGSHRDTEEKSFHEHDLDKNGYMDRKEVAHWMMPTIPVIADQEADHLIKETDTNKDGNLTPDEILEKYESWVGSRATNYGSHLDSMKKEEL